MIYDKDLAANICQKVMEGESLRKICSLPGYPDKSTLFRWLADSSKQDFQRQYALARQIQAETMLDGLLDIIADCPLNAAAIRRAALQVKTQQWLIAKMLPKKYGTVGTGWDSENYAASDMDLSKLNNDELDRLVELLGKAKPD